MGRGKINAGKKPQAFSIPPPLLRRPADRQAGLQEAAHAYVSDVFDSMTSSVAQLVPPVEDYDFPAELLDQWSDWLYDAIFNACRVRASYAANHFVAAANIKKFKIWWTLYGSRQGHQSFFTIDGLMDLRSRHNAQPDTSRAVMRSIFLKLYKGNHHIPLLRSFAYADDITEFMDTVDQGDSFWAQLR